MLSRQSRAIYREKIDPLEEQLHNLYPDDASIFTLQSEFSARRHELEEQNRQIEDEYRVLMNHQREMEEPLRTEYETTIRAKENLIEALYRQMEE